MFIGRQRTPDRRIRVSPAQGGRLRCVEVSQSASGNVTRRHLQAVAKLPVEEQGEMVAKVTDLKLTAQETERLVQESTSLRTGAKRQGAPVGGKKRFVTAQATVTIAFRKRDVAHEDLLAVWDEVRKQIESHAADVA